MIERQGGNIHVRNNEGPGACFYFTLPLASKADNDNCEVVEEPWNPDEEGEDDTGPK